MILFHFHFTSFHSSREDMNSLKGPRSQCMWGFIAQLVEDRTGIRGGHGFESRWSPDFFQASYFQLLKLENLLRWSSRSSTSSLSSAPVFAEVTGSNPVEALNFFQASSFQLLKLENLLRWSSLSSTTAVLIWYYFIHTSHRHSLSSLIPNLQSSFLVTTILWITLKWNSLTLLSLETCLIDIEYFSHCFAHIGKDLPPFSWSCMWTIINSLVQ